MATQDLNQLYQTAMNAFRRATPPPHGLFGATQYPNQGGLTTLPPGAGQVKQPAEFLPGGGIIQPKPLIPRQSIIESDDIEQPFYPAIPVKPPAVMPPHTAVMPPKGHQYKYSEDGQRTTVPLPPGSWDEDNPWGFTIQPLDSKLEALQPEHKTKGPVESIIPDKYGGFFQSQFYNPEAMSMGVLTPVTLPSGETITFPDSESARQFQLFLNDIGEKKMGGQAIPEGSIQPLTGTEPISLTSENAAQYGFTPPDPNMAGAQVMQYWDKHGNVSYQRTPETVYQGTGYSRPEVWAVANGGIVGLDYLTRRI